MKEALEPNDRLGDEGELDNVPFALPDDAALATASLLRKDIWFKATDCRLSNNSERKSLMKSN